MSGQLISSQNLMIYYLKSRLGIKWGKKTQTILNHENCTISMQIRKMRLMRIQGIQLTSLNFQFPITIISLKKGPLKLLK
jgi:hypothetical protein